AANEPLLPRELVVRTALRVVAQARAVRLVGGEAVDGVDAVSDGARSLMRREVADQVCAAAGYRLPPVAGVFLKGGQLERVDLIADEAGNHRAEGSPCRKHRGTLPD